MFSTVPVGDGPAPAWLDRSVAALLVLLGLGFVWLLFGVEPDPRGYDTHVQLGMSPCGWPRTHGMPCPTCGATTAAALLVRGRALQAVAAHPFGAAVALAGLAAAATALYCLLARRSWLDLFAQLPLRLLLPGGILLLGLSWLYKCLTFTGA